MRTAWARRAGRVESARRRRRVRALLRRGTSGAGVGGLETYLAMHGAGVLRIAAETAGVLQAGRGAGARRGRRQRVSGDDSSGVGSAPTCWHHARLARGLIDEAIVEFGRRWRWKPTEATRTGISRGARVAGNSGTGDLHICAALSSSTRATARCTTTWACCSPNRGGWTTRSATSAVPWRWSPGRPTRAATLKGRCRCAGKTVSSLQSSVEQAGFHRNRTSSFLLINVLRFSRDAATD